MRIERLEREKTILKMYGLPRICKSLVCSFDRTTFASMYPACLCSARLLAMMESAHTRPNKAFSHYGLLF